MDRMEILKTATSNVAYAYKRRDLGSLEVGKIGDVVILDANPLESARNYRRVNAVLKDGKVVEQGLAARVFAEPQTDYTRALIAAAFDLEALDTAAVRT